MGHVSTLHIESTTGISLGPAEVDPSSRGSLMRLDWKSWQEKMTDRETANAFQFPPLLMETWQTYPMRHLTLPVDYERLFEVLSHPNIFQLQFI
jgi:hypothetical protein